MSITSKKPGIVICSIAVLTFIAFAGLTTYSVNQLSSEVSHTTIANVSGTPSSWDNYRAADNIISQTESQVKDGYVVYTTSVTNTSQTNSAAVTHIASYISGESKGFVPLSTNSLEYSYYPDAANSWTPVAVSAPGEGDEDFKLASEIYLGTGDSSNNAVYFRYFVAPSEEGTISNKITFLTKTSDDESLISVSNNSIAYTDTTSDIVAVSDQDQNQPQELATVDNTGESAFAEPLGATSEAPAVTTISLAGLGAIVISPEVMTGSLIVLVVCLGIFAASLVVYLVARKKEEQKSRLF